MKLKLSPAEKVLFFCLRVCRVATTLLFGRKNLFSRSTILCFHSISDDGWRFSTPILDFEAQMRYLQRHSTIVPLSKLLSYKGKGPITSITFDDGYASVFENAWPILKKYNITPTVFVIGDRDRINRNELDNSFDLLTTEQIKTLHSSGWEIGFHTATHAYLKGVPDKVLVSEIVRGKKQLEQALGFNVHYFAYPRGGYDNRVVQRVKDAGFAWGFTVNGGNLKLSNRYAVTRLPIEGRMRDEEFLGLMSPIGSTICRWYLVLLQLKAETTSYISTRTAKLESLRIEQ